jgi:uncharacterized protein YndB with AHSA1/START domain
MIDFTIDTEIARPPADVFAYATDPAKLGTWQTNTVSAVPEPEGPLRLGSRIREVHRAPGGKEMPSVVEVSQFEPDRVFGLRIVEGALPLHADMTFEGTNGGTLVRFRAHGQPTGAMRIAQPLLRRTLRKQFAEDCATLKRVLEAA